MSVAENARIVVLLGAAMAVAWGAVCSDEIVSLDDYLAELRSISLMLEEGEADASILAARADSLPESWIVEAGDARFRMSNAALRDALSDPAHRSDGGASAFGHLEATLTLLAAEAGGWSPVDPGVEGPRETLERILAGREFSAVSAPGPIDRLRDRITDWIEEVLTILNRGIRNSPVLAEAIAWGVVALVLAVVIVLVVRAGKGRLLNRIGLDRDDPKPTGRRDYLEEAVLAARSGRFRHAVRYAYWAAIHRMAEEGVWPLDTTRTHREYLRSLPDHHPRRPAMARATRHFESVWYGGAPATEADLDEALGRLRELGLDTSWRRPTAGS